MALSALSNPEPLRDMMATRPDPVSPIQGKPLQEDSNG